MLSPTLAPRVRTVPGAEIQWDEFYEDFCGACDKCLCRCVLWPSWSLAAVRVRAEGGGGSVVVLEVGG